MGFAYLLTIGKWDLDQQCCCWDIGSGNQWDKIMAGKMGLEHPFHDPQCCIELTTVSSIIITIGKAYYSAFLWACNTRRRKYYTLRFHTSFPDVFFQIIFTQILLEPGSIVFPSCEQARQTVDKQGKKI
jgi:hypothetical protein